MASTVQTRICTWLNINCTSTHEPPPDAPAEEKKSTMTTTKKLKRKKTNFWSLPKVVREKIYRLHLVHEKPITDDEHHEILRHDLTVAKSHKRRRLTVNDRKAMPPLFEVSPKAEKEAAPIYYGENHFFFGDVRRFGASCRFFDITPQRHLKFIRKMSCTWDPKSIDGSYGGYGIVRENWRRLIQFKSLEVLNVGVDEEDMINHLPKTRGEKRQRSLRLEESTPQQQLAILRLPGMTGLLSISGVKGAKFVELENEKGEKHGGPLAGGPLETHILPRLKASPIKPKRFMKKRPFPFLELPAELRNRIYDLILHIPGPIHPSTAKPTTAPKDVDNPKFYESEHTESALSLLLVNKQVHDETIGLFYNGNAFVFYYPTQLNAFLLSIGTQRQRLLRDLTVDYHNLKLGGVNLVDLTFPLLKQLTRLGRLHVIMKSSLDEAGLRQGWMVIPWGREHVCYDPNPITIPGIQHLFHLRGVTDIKIRDIELEKKVKDLEKERGYPQFANSSKNRDILRLSRAYEHFNVALSAAQAGILNPIMLDKNSRWNKQEPFPDLKTAEDVGGESDEQVQDQIVDTAMVEDDESDESMASDDDSDGDSDYIP